MSKIWEKSWFAPVASAATSFLFPSLGDKIGGVIGLSGDAANIAGNALVGAGIGALSNGGQGALTGALAGGLTRGLTGLTGFDGGLSGFMNTGSFAGGLGGTALGQGGIGSDAVASKAGALTQAGAAQNEGLLASLGLGGSGGMGDLVKLAPLALIGATLMGGLKGPKAPEAPGAAPTDAKTSDAYEEMGQPLEKVKFERNYTPYRGDYTKYGQVGQGGEHEFYENNGFAAARGGMVRRYAEGGSVAPSPSGWQQPTWGALRSFGAPRWAGPSFDPGAQMQEMGRPPMPSMPGLPRPQPQMPQMPQPGGQQPPFGKLPGMPDFGAFRTAAQDYNTSLQDWISGLGEAIRNGTAGDYRPVPMLNMPALQMFQPSFPPGGYQPGPPPGGFQPMPMPDAPTLQTESGMQPPAPAQQLPPMTPGASSSSSSSSSSVSGSAANGSSWSGSSGTMPPTRWQPPQIPRSPMQGGALTRFGGMSAPRFAKGGMASPTGRSDDVPALLSEGEYVLDAETVALLGDGSSEAGAKKLDRMREQIRRHKGRALAKGQISPDARDPVRYVGLH